MLFSHVLSTSDKFLFTAIAACDFMVCSSLYEGLAVVSQEAIVLGKPIISTCGVVGELFADADCGTIVENNETSLSEELCRYLTDPALLKRKTAGARARSSFFSLKNNLANIEDLIDQP